MPFTVDSAPSAVAASLPPAANVAATFVPVLGSAAPGDGRSFPLGGGAARPRGGRVFRSALAFDVDGDTTTDLVAWTETPEGRLGELVLINGANPAAGEIVLAKLPKDLDLGRCSHEAEIQRLAATIVVVRASAECGDERGKPPTKESWLAFARLDAARSKTSPRPPELRLEARARTPVELSATSSDRDGDGHADLVLVASATAAEPRLEVPLVLFDRPAGYAWDPAEPEASFQKAAARVLATAKRGEASATRQAEELLGFAGAVCPSIGDPKITVTAGAIPCEGGRFVSDIVFAAGNAALGEHDTTRAALAADLLGSIDGGETHKKQLEALLGQNARTVEASVVRRPAARPAKKPSPLAPLAFDGAGGLLVETEDGVLRVDLAQPDETKSEALPWPRGIAWKSGDATVEILRAERRCDPPSRVIVATAKGTTALTKLPSLASLVPKEAKRAGCKPGPLPLSPLVVDPTGATLAVGGEVFRLTFGDAGIAAERANLPAAGGAPSLPGAARSADGRAAVLALSEGLLVVTETGTERWRGADLAGLYGCVVEASGDRVACLSRDGVVIVAPR